MEYLALIVLVLKETFVNYMLSSDFIKYLEGYLDGKPEGLSKEDVAVLQCKMKEITPDIKDFFPRPEPNLPNYPNPYPSPWWGIFPPNGEKWEITCNSAEINPINIPVSC